MHRRSWLQLAGGATLSACFRARHPRSREVRAVAFDLFTVFDWRTIDRRAADIVHDRAAGFAATCKTRLFEASWQRAVANRYVAFDRLVADAVDYACRAHGVALAEADRAHLAAAFTELDPWPDAGDVLRELRARGLRLATLANYAPAMMHTLLERSALAPLFDLQISTDEARTYKPDPRAYALGEQRLDLPRAQIAFSAFGSWDATGAAWFGFPTFWVNRFAIVSDEPVPGTASGPDLVHLASWLEDRR